MAPIFEEGQQFINVYLPAGTWKHLWTDSVYTGPTRATVFAPVGKPVVFFDSTWPAGKVIYDKIRSLPKTWLTPTNNQQVTLATE